MRQVSGFNVKGILCTTKGYQESVMSVAKYYGIALIRINEDIGFKWDLYRVGRSTVNRKNQIDKIKKTLTDNSISTAKGFFAAYYNNQYTYSALGFLNGFAKIDNHQKQYKGLKNINIPFIESNNIKKVVNIAYSEYGINRNTQDYYKSLLDFLKAIENDFSIIDNCDLGLDLNDSEIIGLYQDKCIYTVDKKNYQNNRYIFTIAHELGHHYLHSSNEWFEYYSLIHRDTEEIEYSLTENQLKRLEIQANIFAAELLVPDTILKIKLDEIIKTERLINKGYGYLYLDHQRVNRDQFQRILTILKRTFRASNSVLEFKLREIGFLNRSVDWESRNVYTALSNMLDGNDET